MSNTSDYLLEIDFKKFLLDSLGISKNEILIFCLAQICDGHIHLSSKLYFTEGVANDYTLTIDKTIQLKFIKLLQDNEDSYPCIIHSHVGYHMLNFSIIDRGFENHFNLVSKKMGLNHTVLMLLVGQKCGEVEYIMHCEELDSMNIRFSTDQIV